MSSIAQPWLINKFVDPIFAICVGVTAAALRVQRDEREKFPAQDSSYGALLGKGQIMSKNYFGSDPKK